MKPMKAIKSLLVLAVFLSAAWTPFPAANSASCDGSESSIAQPPRFGRLMHDPQWMEWPSRMADPDWPRGFYYDWYPETVKLTTGPKSGDGAFNYTREWLEYLRELQPNDYAATWIARVAA